jgi:anaerobic ribonucleoside-triphosphate reductase activating protein
MNYMQIDKASIGNGSGVRVVLWVSGCQVHCKGCQNPESWDFNAGRPFDGPAKQELFKTLCRTYIRGLTISGGHPLECNNLPDMYNLIKEVRTKFPEKDIWLYTGYTLSFNDFDTTAEVRWDNSPLRNYILAMCDVVVDGPYVQEQRDITLKFRGSKNQRLIDVQETIKQGKVITIQD